MFRDALLEGEDQEKEKGDPDRARALLGRYKLFIIPGTSTDGTRLKQASAWLSIVLEFCQWASFAFIGCFAWNRNAATDSMVFLGSFPFSSGLDLDVFDVAFTITGTYGFMLLLGLFVWGRKLGKVATVQAQTRLSQDKSIVEAEIQGSAAIKAMAQTAQQQEQPPAEDNADGNKVDIDRNSVRRAVKGVMITLGVVLFDLGYLPVIRLFKSISTPFCTAQAYSGLTWCRWPRPTPAPVRGTSSTPPLSQGSCAAWAPTAAASTAVCRYQKHC
jgi:hypothetical protein